MNKSESKYFNTAVRMDKAYLHYETIADLLDESVEYMSNGFLKYFCENDISSKIKNSNLDELIFIKPDYIIPYLSYIRHTAA